ncbi:CPBP family intramembrane glutamic endopeptidase [Tsuneonella amylolytica]|uniref:CPBP family intramembrane glutamic endopeptidase n=1 Tax=Tsuneonella amylolytica TaxID=2338327 RepID=UPI000EAA932F|nr:CPBP family intramembrane glutamic endopeptidase [Tsuneonella amylolytica]
MGERKPLPNGSLALLMGMQAAFFTLLGFIAWSLSGRSASRFVEITPTALLSGFGLGLGLILVGALVQWLAPHLFERVARLQHGTAKLLGGRQDLKMFAWISLCAGIGEEALFRGGLQTLLADYLGDTAAVLLAAAAFALVHFAKPPIAAVIFALGCLFGAVYAATGSLATVMVGHFVYDVWALRALFETLDRLHPESPTIH